MLVVNTIQEFMILPMVVQTEILRSIKAKDRLDSFLRSMNNTPMAPAGWVPCKHCLPGQPGKCGHCPADTPGYIWREVERDNSDIHPSQIDKCLKYLVLCCSGYADQHEEFVDPKLRMIFDIGSAWHTVMQRYGKQGAWCDPGHYHPEAPIDPDALTFDGRPALPIAQQYWIRGSADALLDYYTVTVPGVGPVALRIIHEYKTINSNGFDKLIRPKPEHKKQATIYSAVFDVPVVVYLYTNKNNCQTIDFPVPFDYTIWQEITAKIGKVQYYVDGGYTPPWEETSAVLSPSDCDGCPLQKACQPPKRR
jgi:hypothetical protein